MFWMAVEMIIMICHLMIRTWNFYHANSRICLVWALSWFYWNLSYAWLKALVSASSFPTLTLSSEKFEGTSHHMWENTTTTGIHKSSTDNFEGHRWTVTYIYIYNKIGKTQAILLTLIFLIPVANTLTTFYQVSSYMYDNGSVDTWDLQ